MGARGLADEQVGATVIRFYPADIIVTIAITVVLLAVAYVRFAKPRHDPWQPDELSARLGPPFPSPTNGVRKC